MSVQSTESTSKAKATSFGSFLFQANLFYKSIGMVAFDRTNSGNGSIVQWLFYIFNMLNLNWALFSEVMFVIVTFRDNGSFVDAITNLSYIGYVLVGDVKILSIWSHKAKLSQLMQGLEDMYPQEATLQKEYRVKKFLRRYNIISFGFVICYQILIWTYNLFAIMNYLIYDYWLQSRHVTKVLPYFVWYPFDYKDNWAYEALYILLCVAGHTSTAGYMANDLLLCVVVTQLIMHFEFLAVKMRSHVSGFDGPKGSQKDIEFLQQAIAYHAKILKLSDKMNAIFGLSLLCNFLTASFIMCFIGFQITIGIALDVLATRLMFLFCSLVQVYMISNYAQQLITASEDIGNAIYEHDWSNASDPYKKLMVLIIRRSQRPVKLKATIYLDISRGTITDLLQISYKFFALIRTMYSTKVVPSKE